jgi:hypothetical protein
MNPTLSLLFGGLAGTMLLATVAVIGALTASKRADEQAARVALPVRSRLNRRTHSSLRN